MVGSVATRVAHVQIGDLVPLFEEYPHVFGAQTTPARSFLPFLERQILKALDQPPLARG